LYRASIVLSIIVTAQLSKPTNIVCLLPNPSKRLVNVGMENESKGISPIPIPIQYGATTPMIYASRLLMFMHLRTIAIIR
jgi:hypothetical protein